MADLKLVIGDKNTSSWSLRPWLLLKHAQIPFEEISVQLHGPDSKAVLRKHSPSGLVPVLIDGDVRIWDSLAICEYLAEQQPGLWPKDAAARAHARSISAEMHSGFSELRRLLPMNWLGRDLEADLDQPGLKQEITRVIAIWHHARARFGSGGPFLTGSFGIADAMYAPVALRFLSYGVDLDDVSRAYVSTLMEMPILRDWAQGAQEQTAPADTTKDEAVDTQQDKPADMVKKPVEAVVEKAVEKAVEAPAGPEEEPPVEPPQPVRRKIEIKPIGGGILRRRSGKPPA